MNEILPPPLLLACEHCDTLYTEPARHAGQIASCRGCGRVLRRGRPLSAEAFLALSLAAMVVFALANLFPVIGVQIQGQRSEATLAQAIAALAHGPYLLLGLIAGFSTLVVPAVQIALVAWVSAHARAGRRAPGLAGAMRLLEQLRPWSMVEVFVIGALVTVVKLSAFLEVIPGIGIVSLLALSVLITWLAGQRVRELWLHLPTDPAQEPAAR